MNFSGKSDYAASIPLIIWTCSFIANTSERWLKKKLILMTEFRASSLESGSPIKTFPIWKGFFVSKARVGFEHMDMGSTTSERRMRRRRSALPMSAVNGAQAE